MAKAKRVIYLFQSGAPSQMELFDHKPSLEKYRGQNLPESIRQGPAADRDDQRASNFPVAPSIFKFAPHGQSGTHARASLLPNIATVVDDLAIVKSMYTEAINHDPAITFFQTGNQLAGRPSIGSWLATAWAARIRTCRRTSC